MPRHGGEITDMPTDQPKRRKTEVGPLLFVLLYPLIMMVTCVAAFQFLGWVHPHTFF